MLNADVLTFHEFVTHEPLPLSRIQEAVLEFLQGRDDAVLFGAQAVNAYVSEPRATQDVDIMSTRAVELAGHGSISMGVQPATLEVAPNRDLFVPFEFPIAELPSGWYRLECDVAIDGVAQTVHPGDGGQTHPAGVGRQPGELVEPHTSQVEQLVVPDIEHLGGDIPFEHRVEFSVGVHF